MEQLRFVVVAPARQIKAGVFGTLCDKPSIAEKVRDRVNSYGAEKEGWHSKAFEPVLERIDISLVSWEEVLQTISHQDAASAAAFHMFYERCLNIYSTEDTKKALLDPE